MEKPSAELQLRTAAALILEELSAYCLSVPLSVVNNRWFGGMLGRLTDYNLLTFQEINTIFGWKESMHAAKYHGIFLSPRGHSLEQEMPPREILQRLSALFGVVAMKYQLSCTFVPFIPSPEPAPPVTSPAPPVVQKGPVQLHLPIADCGWYQALGVRAWNALKNKNIETQGQLLMLTEDDLLVQDNFGRKSLNEIKGALGKEGLSLSSVTAEEYAVYMKEREEIQTDQLPAE